MKHTRFTVTNTQHRTALTISGVCLCKLPFTFHDRTAIDVSWPDEPGRAGRTFDDIAQAIEYANSLLEAVKV